jgi:hypothetical protein
MTKTKKITASVVVLVGLILAALVVRIPIGPSAEQLRADAARELPIGSSRDQVVAFAKNHGMEQSTFLERERMINAIKRSVSRGLFSETSVAVQFYFDEKNTLQRISVNEASTGL